jgi:dipeptidyl aminopeptidase/acylaminoacyl peptidase
LGALHPHAYRGQPPVAYVSRGQVFVLDGTGRPPRPVDDGRASCCVAWAPDGAHLGFQRGAELWMSDTDGQHTRRVASNVRRWSWSPDGEAIAVLPRARGRRPASGLDFYAIDLPRFRLTLLRHDDVVDFAWAGRGRRVAVSTRSASDGSPSSGATTLLMLEVPGPYGDCATLCPEPAQPVAIDNPSTANPDIYFAGWAPDIASLAIWTAPPGPRPVTTGLDLALVAPSGGPITPLARTVVKRSWVQWQRTGDRLLAVEDRAGGSGSGPALTLCVLASGCQVVDRAAASVTDPAWSDSDRMAYVTNAAGPGSAPTRGDNSRLWVADRDGRAATVVAGGGATSPRWLPDGRHLLFTRRATLWLLDAATGAAVPIAGPLGSRSIGPGGAAPVDGTGRGTDRLFAVAP